MGADPVTGWLRRLHVTYPMTRGAAYSTVFLFFLCLLLAGANLVWTGHQVAYNNAARAREAAAQQASQRRQGQLIERRLCATLHGLAALQPPPGSPQANPARGYEQQLQHVLSQLGPDIGCGAKTYPAGSQQPSPVSRQPPVVTGTRTPPPPRGSQPPGPQGQQGSGTRPAGGPAPAPASSPVFAIPGVLTVTPPCLTVLILNACIGT